MRKTTIVSAIIACISFCLFAASAVFIKWSRTDADATPSIIITSILSIAIVDAAAIALALIFDKKHEMILIAPIVSLFALTIMFTKGINELLGDNGASIIDFISPSSNNPTVLALLLAILFIVAVILVLSKKYKFASIIAVSYASFISAVKSRISIKKSSINTNADTSVVISANGGNIAAQNNEFMVTGGNGRIAELFGVTASFKENNFKANLVNTTSKTVPLYVNKATKLTEEKNSVQGF